VSTLITLQPCYRYIGDCLLSMYVPTHWTMYCFCLMRFLLSRQIREMTFSVWYGPLDHVGRISSLTGTTVVLHAGSELCKCQDRKSFYNRIYRCILLCSIPSCLCFFLPFSWSIQAWYDACVSLSLTYCSTAPFTAPFTPKSDCEGAGSHFLFVSEMVI